MGTTSQLTQQLHVPGSNRDRQGILSRCPPSARAAADIHTHSRHLSEQKRDFFILLRSTALPSWSRVSSVWLHFTVGLICQRKQGIKAESFLQRSEWMFQGFRFAGLLLSALASLDVFSVPRPNVLLYLCFALPLLLKCFSSITAPSKAFASFKKS